MTKPVQATLALLLPIALVVFLLLLPRGERADDVSSGLRRDTTPTAIDLPPGTSPRGEVPPAPATLRGHAAREGEEVGPGGVRLIVQSRLGIRIPGAGVVATWPGEGGEARTLKAETGSDGSVFLPDVPCDGSARATVRPSAKDESTTQGAEIRLASREVTATVDPGLPLHVRCVDDLTGREIPDAIVQGAVPRPASDEGFPDGDGWILALVGPAKKANVRFRVEAPPGFVAWDATGFLASIGTWTRELEVVYPLRHEADVRVTILDHAGAPEDRATVDGFLIGGVRGSGHRSERLGPGAFRLRGVPFFRRALLAVMVSTPELEDGFRENAWLPARLGVPTEIVVTLPRPGEEQTTHDSLIGLGGGAGGTFGGRGRSGPMGDALIVVQRHDGRPASNVGVHVGGRIVETDEQGRALVAELPVGEHKVTVHAIGLLPLEDVVRVEAGQIVRLDLREPAGGAIDVQVVDADGDPLPYATLHVRMPSRAPWVDERDGRQRVDPFTDHLGRRRVERVEAGTVVVRADWGGRTAMQAVEVHEGRLTHVTLVPK